MSTGVSRCLELKYLDIEIYKSVLRKIDVCRVFLIKVSFGLDK